MYKNLAYIYYLCYLIVFKQSSSHCKVTPNLCADSERSCYVQLYLKLHGSSDSICLRRCRLLHKELGPRKDNARLIALPPGLPTEIRVLCDAAGLVSINDQGMT